MNGITKLSLPRRELAIASVCAGVLLLEICLTKLFSIVLWYHFGFLAVSTALLGFASSGVYLALKDKALHGSDADPAIGRSAALAAVAVVASLWLITQTRFDVQSVVHDRTLGSLLALVLWITLPFFFLGLTIARTLSAYPDRVGRLYASDLIGSAVGCGLAVLLLSLELSAQVAIVTGAAFIGLGAMLFALRRPRTLLASAAAAAIPVALLVRGGVEETFPLLSSPSKIFLYPVEQIDDYMTQRDRPIWRRGEVTLKSGETFELESPYPPVMTADGSAYCVDTDDGKREIPVADVDEFEAKSWTPFRRWNSMSRVDAFHWPSFKGPCGLWGLSPKYFEDGNGPIPKQKGVTLDAWAFTTITRYSGKPLQPASDPAVAEERAKLKVLDYLPAATVHRLKENADNILVIGAGGGLDILTAKYFGVKKITGVEINPGVAQAVREAFPEFAGHLYDPKHHPEIDVHVAEGRHFLQRSEQKYDIIQLSGVDTLSSTEAGAFALSENFLYTTQAFDAYLGHLAPNGALTLTRWFIPHVRDGVLEPREELRLLGLARESLAKAGLENPGEGIFYLNSANFTVILIKPAGFTAEESAMLTAYCKERDFEVLWSPHERIETLELLGKTYANPFLAFLESPDPDAYLAASRFDVTPPTDDRPFFFETSRFGSILSPEHYTNARGLSAHGILVLLFLEVLVLGFLFVIVPMRRLRAPQGEPISARARAGLLVYFTAIGLGFILVEIVLSQKFVFFLGHPFFALSVILFSLLLFSGIGAGLSSRFPLPRFATLFAGVIAVGSVLLFDAVFASALHLPLAVRIGISVAMLAPVGLMMGVPFPAGIRLLARTEPRLIPWAWGVNGYTSVLGSVLAVMLGIELGFMAVLFLASAVYATGVVGYSLMTARAAAKDAAEPAAAADATVISIAERRYARAE